MNRRYDAVIFDLDGTLIDSAEAICLIAGRFLAEQNARSLTIDETRGFVGRGGVIFAQRMLRARDFPDEGEEANTHIARFLALYDEAPGGENPPYPGVDAMLDALDGVSLGLCTNKPYRPTLNILDALNWRERFSCVVGGDTLTVRKPNPEPLLHTVRALGMPMERTLFVGDSETDTETAQAAGIDYALHTNGYRHAAAEDMPALLHFDDFSVLTAFILDQ